MKMNKETPKIKLYYKNWIDKKTGKLIIFVFPGYARFRCNKCSKEITATSQGFNCTFHRKYKGLSPCCGSECTIIAKHPDVPEIELVRLTYPEAEGLKKEQELGFEAVEGCDFVPSQNEELVAPSETTK